MKDLKIKQDTLNLIEEEVRNSLELMGTREDFLNKAQTTQALRSAVNKWDLMILRSIYLFSNYI